MNQEHGLIFVRSGENNKMTRVLLTGGNVKCAYCGNPLYVQPSRLKRYKQHYCNRSCYLKSVEQMPFKSPEILCSTYIDSSGRARVYCPSHPRSYISGYLLRDIVHWEYYHQQRVPKGFDVHHINHNRIDDTKENLIILEHKGHSKLHNPIKESIKICKTCGCEFKIKTWRLREKSRGQYCSQGCFHKRKNGI